MNVLKIIYFGKYYNEKSVCMPQYMKRRGQECYQKDLQFYKSNRFYTDVQLHNFRRNFSMLNLYSRMSRWKLLFLEH